MELETLYQSSRYLLVFFSVFVVIYLLAYFVVFRNWSPKTRPEASSCLISLFHGTPAVFLALYALNADPNRGFSSPNTEFQNVVIEYSISYFLTDLLHYAVFYPKDVLFIGHHVATLFVLLTCRYLVFRGAYEVLGLLVLAEVTSFCQNLWTLASARRSDLEFAARVYAWLSLPFYVFYSIVRGFVAPFFVYRMGLFYASGKAEVLIPKWLWISWMVVIVVAISLSILWISNLWIELQRERRSSTLQKKLR